MFFFFSGLFPCLSSLSLSSPSYPSSRRRLSGGRLERDLLALGPHEPPDLRGGLGVHEEVLVVEPVLDDELEVLRLRGVEREDELLGRGVAGVVGGRWWWEG